jgi:hypothetical protein
MMVLVILTIDRFVLQSVCKLHGDWASNEWFS